MLLLWFFLKTFPSTIGWPANGFLNKERPISHFEGDELLEVKNTAISTFE